MGRPGLQGYRHRWQPIDRYSDDGVFAAIEVGLLTAQQDSAPAKTKLAIGAWIHTTEIEDLKGNPEDRNAGAYLIAESVATESITGFVQIGATDTSVNRITWYLGAGLTATGWIPGRPNDQLGLAAGTAINGDEFLDKNEGYDRHETVIELTWEAQITEHIVLQPDLQYVMNPGDQPDTDDALQVGVRATLSY